MKTIFFDKARWTVLGIFAFTAAFSQNPTQTENYIYVQEPTVGVSAVTNTTAAIRAVQYFDGLGRPKQTIQIKASPDQGTTNNPKNLVTKYEYDGFGRQVIDFLPVPVLSQNEGQITSDADYNTHKTQQYGSQVYYSEKTLENSPLNRVMKQAAPGNDWAKNSGHEIEFEYRTNTANEVWIYWINTSGNIQRGGYFGKSHYDINTLYKTTTTDENGNKIHEFKDKQGRVILKRTHVGGGLIAGKATNPDTEALLAADTYYIYDVYGNLVAVVPPLAALKSTITSTVQSNLCYTYKYDDRNRLVEKKLPGKEIEYMVYDKQDRLVATQDANLRDLGYWLFTKYDKYGRVIYTGIYQGGSSRTSVQTAANNAINNNNETRNTSGFTQNGMTVRYTKTAFPTTIVELLSVNYYDYYETNLGFTPSAFTQQTVRSGLQTANKNNNLKGLPVTTLVRVLGTNTWERIFNVYDIKSRLVGTYKQNHLGGFTKTESKLNFRGLPEYTITDHNRTSNGIAVRTRDVFTYDNMERLVKHTQSLDNNLMQNLIASNQYDKLGQLITKKVGGTASNATDRWQEVNYTYNIRGWLTNINDIGLTLIGKDAQPPTMGDDLFAFRIQYNSLVNGGSNYTEPLYNGNIAQTFWKTTEDNIVRGYHYTYDQLNRLRKADFYKQGNANISAYGEYLAYDVNGNILSLNRSMGDANDNEVDMDKLVYTYDGGNSNSNRLIKVVDNASTAASHGFNNGNSGTSNDYTYDDNGNMLSDLNKGITEILYNHLNLPTHIYFGENGSIEYIYNAAGQKVRKTVYDTPNNTIKHVDYLDGFQYAGDILQFFPHAEGYVSATPYQSSLAGGVDSYLYNYVYNYTDHLGNIRLSYTKDPVSNQLKIMEENHYYPFGLKHSTYATGPKQKYELVENMPGMENVARPTFVLQTDYMYKYNGKEFQDELGLNLYDYGARNYDAAIGRFFNLDRLSEKYEAISPYGYVANNPVYFVDVNGEWIYINDGSNGSYRYTDGQTQKKNEETGKYENIDGNTYLSDFVFESIVNLESLKGSGDTGKGLIDHFDKAGNDVNIEYSKGEFSHTRGTILVDWAVADGAMAMTTEGYQESHNFIELGHELAHAKDKNNYAFNWIPFKSGRNFSENEIYASHVENMIRAESGVPLRTQYGRGIAESTLIDNNGNSVHFNTNGTRKIFNSKQSVIDSWNISKGANGGEILKNRYNYYQNHSGGCYCGN